MREKIRIITFHGVNEWTHSVKTFCLMRNRKFSTRRIAEKEKTTHDPLMVERKHQPRNGPPGLSVSSMPSRGDRTAEQIRNKCLSLIGFDREQKRRDLVGSFSHYSVSGSKGQEEGKMMTQHT
jgi:hypothetical protein